MLAAVVPNIVDMRVIKDKYTGEQQHLCPLQRPT
jgi:hypothetical protein